MHFMRFALSLLWVRLNVGTAAVTVLTVFLFPGSNKTVDGCGAIYGSVLLYNKRTCSLMSFVKSETLQMPKNLYNYVCTKGIK